MSWSSPLARALALIVFLPLAGCGIRPLYAPPAADADESDQAVAVDLASVSVDPIADRRGQLLRNRLSGMLRADGETVPDKYRLSVSLQESQQSLAIRTTGFATRANLRMNATYRLLDVSTGQPLVAGSATAISSYDLLDNDFSTLTAIDDARERVVDRLAQDLRNRLAVFFASQPAGATAPPIATPAPPVAPPVPELPSVIPRADSVFPTAETGTRPAVP